MNNFQPLINKLEISANKMEKKENQNPSQSTKTDQEIQKTTKQIQKPQCKKDQKGRLGFKDTLRNISLVLFEVSKIENSSFTDTQKQPIVYSVVGIFFTLAAATTVNMAQFLVKPEMRSKKWFFRLGLTNIVMASALSIYFGLSVNNLYAKLPAEKWNQIIIQKENYDKLSWKQREQLMKKQLKANKLEAKQITLGDDSQQKIQMTK